MEEELNTETLGVLVWSPWWFFEVHLSDCISLKSLVWVSGPIMALEVCADLFPATGISTKYFSMLITVLLFYVVIKPDNEQVARETCHNHVDGNFIMKIF